MVMLDSLYVKNYRVLKELKIDSLSRVNLVTGKNNTGKSTILEAIAMYATKGDVSLIYQLLEERGENYKLSGPNVNLMEINARIFSSLFTNRHVGFDATDAILIGDSENASPERSITLGFMKYTFENRTDPSGNIVNSVIPVNKADKQVRNHLFGLGIKTAQAMFLLPFHEDRPHRFGFRQFDSNSNLQFIRTRNVDKAVDGNLFDKIALTDKERYVVEALKIIEPLTERIAFVEETAKSRNAVIKLSGLQRVLPLQSMGDGINRVLSMILALVNAGDGFLLVDEFENGLHHSVQEQLWDIIFKLAPRLNTQVFATTHSNDCIKGFEAALNRLDDPSAGMLIRLDNEGGRIKHVEFDAKELHVANDQNIEIR
jgi:predicted ATPase